MTKFFRTLPYRLTPAGGPFDDPALLVAPTNAEQAILLDCGTLHGLKTRDLQRVRWLFLTHLHIDHLIGFDHLLRVRLFSPLPLTVYGPPGTLAVIGHRLQGYAWNLTSGSPFVVRVFEIGSDSTPPSAEFRCHHRFEPMTVDTTAALAESPGVDGSVRPAADLVMTCHEVKHGVPCLAYRLERITLPKFSLEACDRLGLTPGRWVRQLVAGEAVTLEVQGEPRDQDWLAEQLLSPPLSSGLGFLTDTMLDVDLTADLSEFFADVDVLCCETAYLDEEANLAAQNLHMTTHQAANLARMCGAREMRIFHVSRRHTQAGSDRHLAEVREIHPNARLLAENDQESGEDIELSD